MSGATITTFKKGDAVPEDWFEPDPARKSMEFGCDVDVVEDGARRDVFPTVAAGLSVLIFYPVEPGGTMNLHATKTLFVHMTANAGQRVK